jgi:hypothetical protein
MELTRCSRGDLPRRVAIRPATFSSQVGDVVTVDYVADTTEVDTEVAQVVEATSLVISPPPGAGTGGAGIDAPRTHSLCARSIR